MAVGLVKFACDDNDAGVAEDGADGHEDDANQVDAARDNVVPASGDDAGGERDSDEEGDGDEREEEKFILKIVRMGRH